MILDPGQLLLNTGWSSPAILALVVAAIIGAAATIIAAFVRKQRAEAALHVEQHGLDEDKMTHLMRYKVALPLAFRIDSLLKKQDEIQTILDKRLPETDSQDPLEKKAYQLYNEAVDLDDRGNKDAATRKLIAAIELKPDLVVAHYNLGVVLAEQGQHDEAAAEYRRAIEIDPNLPAAHCGLGAALFKQGQHDEAVAEFRRAIEIDPNDAVAHSNLGVELGRQGQHDEAEGEFRRAIEIDPNGAVAHYNLGLALGKQGRHDEAAAEYRRAIEIDPNYAAAHYNLACVHARQAEAAAPVASLKAAIDLDQQYRAEAKTDPDFDTIRDHPDFTKLVYGD